MWHWCFNKIEKMKYYKSQNNLKVPEMAVFKWNSEMGNEVVQSFVDNLKSKLFQDLILFDEK